MAAELSDFEKQRWWLEREHFERENRLANKREFIEGLGNVQQMSEMVEAIRQEEKQKRQRKARRRRGPGPKTLTGNELAGPVKASQGHSGAGDRADRPDGGTGGAEEIPKSESQSPNDE